MGSDNQPKHRQARKLQRKLATRPSYDRFLIVCEGSKTEPHYFKEMRAHYRLHTANVQITPGKYGTDPLSVVNYAEDLFIHGNPTIQVSPRSFERVYVLFDRDDHQTYHNALTKADSLDGKLKNDLKCSIAFKALPSVPCFELWLLIHFEAIADAIDRYAALNRLKKYLPDYEKGQGGHYNATRDTINDAIAQAKGFELARNEHDDNGPYCSVYKLIEQLQNLTTK